MIHSNILPTKRAMTCEDEDFVLSPMPDTGSMREACYIQKQLDYKLHTCLCAAYTRRASMCLCV
eukprot:m.155214 g.155214  ORF g.155214 m.155214 type:complete len:64 (+) comp14307_c0_seq6:4321-4512(+)